MNQNIKTILSHNLMDHYMKLDAYDLRIIKQALTEYWYENKNSPLSSDIEKVERKINKVLECF